MMPSYWKRWSCREYQKGERSKSVLLCWVLKIVDIALEKKIVANVQYSGMNDIKREREQNWCCGVNVQDGESGDPHRWYLCMVHGRKIVRARKMARVLDGLGVIYNITKQFGH